MGKRYYFELQRGQLFSFEPDDSGERWFGIKAKVGLGYFDPETGDVYDLNPSTEVVLIGDAVATIVLGEAELKKEST